MGSYDNMTKSQLIDEAAARGIEVGDAWTKAEIIELLLNEDDDMPSHVTPVIPAYDDGADRAVLEIMAAIAASDSRWADLSGRDTALVQTGVARGWLERDSADPKLSFGRCLLTDAGLRKLLDAGLIVPDESKDAPPVKIVGNFKRA